MSLQHFPSFTILEASEMKAQQNLPSCHLENGLTVGGDVYAPQVVINGEDINGIEWGFP